MDQLKHNCTTIATVGVNWLQHKQLTVKLSTLTVYHYAFNHLLMPFFAKSSVITDEDVASYISTKKAQGLGTKTIVDSIIVLKMIYKYGESKGLLPPSQWSVPVKLDDKKTPRIISRFHYKRLIDYVSTHISNLNLGIYICMCTGLRIGEICGLQWGDFNTVEGTLSINRTVERILMPIGSVPRTQIIISTPKTVSSKRIIPLSGHLLRLLVNLKKTSDDKHFVLSGTHVPIEPRSYRNYYHKLCVQLEIPPIKFHALRHSFATLCIDANEDYKVLSSILGHADITTTLNLYVHPGLEQKRRCIDRLLQGVIRNMDS